MEDEIFGQIHRYADHRTDEIRDSKLIGLARFFPAAPLSELSITANRLMSLRLLLPQVASDTFGMTRAVADELCLLIKKTFLCWGAESVDYPMSYPNPGPYLVRIIAGDEVYFL
jgi:hypothetical protein